MSSKKLLSSEWILVFGLFFVMLSLLIVAKVNAARSQSFLASYSLPSQHKPCIVSVRGNVAKPGVFKVLPGTCLKTVLRKCSLRPFSNLKALNVNQRVEEDMEVNVEKLTEIVVYIRGAALEDTSLVVPVGTRVCDLKEKVSCEESVKKQFFKSRRTLKNEEIFSLLH